MMSRVRIFIGKNVIKCGQKYGQKIDKIWAIIWAKKHKLHINNIKHINKKSEFQTSNAQCYILLLRLNFHNTYYTLTQIN
jgi:hypothetical protein